MRKVVGVLAILYVLMHVIDKADFIKKLDTTPDDLHFSIWMGKIAGIAIGMVVAYKCFKKPAKPRMGDD